MNSLMMPVSAIEFYDPCPYVHIFIISMMTSSNGNIFCVARSFKVFFHLRLNKQLGKQSRCRWFETPSRSLWRHCIFIFRPFQYKCCPTFRVIDIRSCGGRGRFNIECCLNSMKMAIIKVRWSPGYVTGYNDSRYKRESLYPEIRKYDLYLNSHLTGIKKSIMHIRWSHDCLIFIIMMYL